MPFGDEYQNWQQYGGKDGGGGLLPVTGAYLANQMGLVDFKDPAQKDAYQKQGLLGTIASNQLGMNIPTGAVPPRAADVGNMSPVNYSLQPVNPQAQRDIPVPQQAATPMKPVSGQDWNQAPGEGFLDKMKNFAAMFIGG